MLVLQDVLGFRPATMKELRYVFSVQTSDVSSMTFLQSQCLRWGGMLIFTYYLIPFTTPSVVKHFMPACSKAEIKYKHELISCE